METFSAPRQLVDHAQFREQRQRCLAGLCGISIDEPILDIINRFNVLPFCFTLQCCYGHFVLQGEDDAHHFNPLPVLETGFPIHYRIAYVAFCLDNCRAGHSLLVKLKTLVHIDPSNIQFGSADWFWERQVNSFVLQVEPARFKFQDSAVLDHAEALCIEKTRNAFFAQLRNILQETIHR